MVAEPYGGQVAERKAAEQVYSITGAETSLNDDLGPRMRRYLLSMSIRTACFIGAVLATGWLRWLLVLGAVLLPYVAVVMANAAPRRHLRPPVPQPARAALPGPSRPLS